MHTINGTTILFFLALLIQFSTQQNISSPNLINNNPKLFQSSSSPNSSPKPDSQQINGTDEQTLALDLHNKYRSQHGAAPFKLNATLNKEAESWADTLISTNKLQIKPGTAYTQNLYEFHTGGTNSPSEEVIKGAVDAWYASKKSYNPADPKPSSFTQLVWKATTDMGVGVSSRNGRTVVVVCYSPAGNIVWNGPGDRNKYFRENVQV